MKLIYNEKARSIFVQVLCLVLFVALTATLVYNAAINLKSQGIASGFGFLSERSGFAINQLPISYSEDSSYFRAFWVALINSVIVSGIGIVLATAIGFLVAICRLSSNYLLSKLAVIYIETLRNLPLLLQIFFWYFVVLSSLPLVRNSLQLGESVFLNNRGLNVPRLVFEPGSWLVVAVVLLGFLGLWVYRRFVYHYQLKTGKRLWLWPYLVVATMVCVGVTLAMGTPLHWQVPQLSGFNFEGGITLSPEFMALLLSLSLYTAAFIAEIVRAGITSVPKGQVEAAKALDLPSSVTLFKIVIPQAMRVIIPPLTSQYLNLTKNSSLAAA
ncbi:amino acid ABC transporter permease, partial [Candidatus Synechococcus spongiarum LMB bulk10D]